LAVLVDAARVERNENLVAQIDNERVSLPEQIGREARGLAWMRDVHSARSPRAARSIAGKPASPLSPRE
jgi:hypothetical protein